MRLVTHNLLRCNIRGLTEEQGFPLKITAEKVEEIPAPYNADLLSGMLRKMDLDALKSALHDLNIAENIQQLESLPESPSEELLKDLHHVLFEVHVQDGSLVCPTTGRSFPVRDGIPNMLLHEDEV